MNTNLKERMAHAILTEHQFSQRPGRPKKGTRASKKTQAAEKRGKKKGIKVGRDLHTDPTKAGEHLGIYSRDSFHAIMDPDNDQYLNQKGTKDE